MGEIDWVVVPSIWWETGPLTVLEAFQYGRPVICSDIGGMAEKVSHGVNVGVPGSGKTILSQQVAFCNASREKPALYLSTLSEPLDKILRYGEKLHFFDPAAVRDGRIVYDDIGQELGEGGLDGVLHEIDRLLREVRPGIVVIDSFRAFHAMASEISVFRQFLYGLLRRLTATATTAIWNAPYGRNQAVEEAESAVADAIVALDIRQTAEREVRVIQVLKLRGSAYQSGEHTYRISESGFAVFPRLAEAQIESRYQLRKEHTATGIAALDDLLGKGGYWAGASTLVAGPSGIGKTLMGLHFLYQGARAGQPGVLATFHENETQLARIVESFGWSIDDPDVHVMARGVVGMNIDEWVYDLLELADRTGARRIVIDSVPDLEIAAGDPIRFREWMFSMMQRFTRSSVSLMMIIEVPELFQLNRVSEQGISHLADNVILLQYVQDGAELARALTVLKTRAQQHRPIVHRYEITDKGFVLGEMLPVTR
jgi:circadian clock protein KaiC